MDASAARFFSTPHFAVDISLVPYPFTGRNTDQSKDADYQVALEGLLNGEVCQRTLGSVGDRAILLTPPAATKKVLEEAKAAGISSVWLQPGSFDDSILTWAKTNFESAIGGYEGGTRGGEGWCVLVDGEDAMKAAGRTWKQQKL
ncbi:uncharacterized protein AB675_6574 [Cyphellophora attinorum]|uniref:CoA-binding domain-containing protein n=1 Tax=Cyphellophora attinorum TaxID=1664694 RepID=A0A0N1P3M0_9EURO|nr:uncharacterized protein AB675_6574 [Phialophora attinorum]KPI44167.1 hypothetical protein AB675_6574 [Phialophora attinorum]